MKSTVKYLLENDTQDKLKAAIDEYQSNYDSNRPAKELGEIGLDRYTKGIGYGTSRDLGDYVYFNNMQKPKGFNLYDFTTRQEPGYEDRSALKKSFKTVQTWMKNVDRDMTELAKRLGVYYETSDFVNTIIKTKVVK